jgi:PST family polysaccharide transporter
MIAPTASYRRILTSSSIIGGASVINIVIGLVRTKVLAVLLGPAGMGLVGLYSALMGTAATLTSMGLGTAGARQIAEAIGKEDAHGLAVARRAMFWGTLMLASAGGLVVWSLRAVLAVRVLGGAEHAGVVGWLALGVALSVAGASQGALIQGMRRIGDMARLSVYGAVLNTILGIGLLWQWGSAALWAFMLVIPVVNFALGHMYVERLPKADADKITIQEMAAQWKTLARLGIAFMGASLVQSLVYLWIRVIVSDGLGLEAVGHYQAASTISTQYVGFVLGAMAADYYPRLTSVIDDKVTAKRLVNEQTEIALLLSAPIFIAMIGLAPWVLHLLYSAAFTPAVDVLRWQILGDVIKIASWPLGFVILASGDGKSFFWSETSAFLLMAGLTAWLLPHLGLQSVGIAFFLMYAFYLPLVWCLARKRIDFAWSSTAIKLLVTVFGLCVANAMIASYSSWGTPLSLLLPGGFCFYTFTRLAKISGTPVALRMIMTTIREMTGVREK